MTTIRFERDGAIGNIVLANPPFNRLDLRFAEALRAAVHQASESDIRVLVVRSEGPHFSFGGEVREWPGKDVNWFRTFVADVNVSYRAIEMLKIPTVAVVQGIAFGGGFELALACDFLVAADNADPSLRRSYDGDAADRRRLAADRRARRPRSRIAICHAGRADFRTRSRRARNRDACGAGERAFSDRGRIGPATRDRADQVVRRDAHAAQGLVERRRRRRGPCDARRRDGALQRCRCAARLCEHGGCLQQGHRTADARVRRKMSRPRKFGERWRLSRFSLSTGGIRAARKLCAW